MKKILKMLLFSTVTTLLTAVWYLCIRGRAD